MTDLKGLVEGDRRRVRSSPEVWVTIEELIPMEGAAITFSPLQFTLSDLEFRTLVEVKGTAAELAQVLGGQAAEKAMDRLGLSGSVRAKASVASFRAAAAGKALLENTLGTLGVTPKNAHFVRIAVTVDLRKDFGAEEVLVHLKHFKTDISAFEWLLSSDKARSIIESAISQKASEVATRMAKKRGHR